MRVYLNTKHQILLYCAWVISQDRGFKGHCHHVAKTNHCLALLLLLATTSLGKIHPLMGLPESNATRQYCFSIPSNQGWWVLKCAVS